VVARAPRPSPRLHLSPPPKEAAQEIPHTTH
jgi:hypothetical protein